MKVQLNDIEVGYTVAGVGEPVVLIHGLAQDRSTWAVVQAAITDHCTHAVDLRGHGETTLGQAEGTLAQLGGDLIRFLEKVTGPATCVGFSLGGTVVLWAAAHRPDLVRHPIVAGTSSVVGRAAVGFFEERIRQVQQDFAVFAQALKADTASMLATAADQVDAVTARRLWAVHDGGGFVNAARAMARLSTEPLSPLLSKVRCRVDAIYGELDAFCPEKALDILARDLPQLVRHKVEGASHLMGVDQPQAFVEAIRAALSQAAASH
jgi:3-oxoadipate enol-lactonase